MPAFQPYWGKPAVRNDREDRGNVGIIRSPIRASIPPDLTAVGLLLALRADHAVRTRSNRVVVFKQGSSTGHGWRYTMSPTITECLERAREMRMVRSSHKQ